MPRRKPLPIDFVVHQAIEKLSADSVEKLRQFSLRGTQLLARTGEPIANDEHDLVVHDAIADTLCGVVTWDRRIEILVHLYSVVRSRLTNRIRRARKRAHVSLDAGEDEEALTVVSREGAADVLLGRSQVTDQLHGALRELAAGDSALLSILAAYRAGVFHRRAVMARTGLTLADYVNARRRLDRLLAMLPTELLQAAREAIEDGAEIQMQLSETTRETNR